MSDKFGEGRDPYLYPGLDIMRNILTKQVRYNPPETTLSAFVASSSGWNRPLTK